MHIARLTPLALALITLFAAPAFAADNVSQEDKKSLTSPDPEQAPISIDADHIEGSQADEIRASGEVQVRQTNQTITAPEVIYKAAPRQIEAAGPVCVQSPDATISGTELKIDDQQRGSMQEVRYAIALPEQQSTAQGSADEVEFQGKNRYRLKGTLFTTCPISDPDWYLKVDTLELDKNRNLGVARHAKLYFKNTPIGYVPYVDFPLDDSRKSGFLVPSFGTSVKNGVELEIPYYVNIAPNQDATITPRLMSERGVQVKGQYRYLSERSNGSVELEALPQDRLKNDGRYFAGLRHSQDFGNGLAGSLNIQQASDDEYFRDLGSQMTVTSQTTLPRDAALTYNKGGWETMLRYQDYQVLQDPNRPFEEPYSRLQFTADRHDKHGPFETAFEAELVDFRHDQQGKVQGTRASVYPQISLPLGNSFAFVTPKVGLHATSYQLDKDGGLPDTNRVLPIVSVDSGLKLERPIALAGQGFTQTLEPRLFYLNVPYRDQSQIPLFDSGQADFSYEQLFSENRFAGIDRFSDANQITAAVSSRLLEDSTGRERITATVAQRFNLERQRVSLPGSGSDASPRKSSDLLASLGGELTPRWHLHSSIQMDTDDSQTNKAGAGVSYRPDPGKVVNLNYRFIRDGLENAPGVRHVDVSSQWPLRRNLYGLAHVSYSLNERKVLEGVAGLEYNGGCWQLRTVVQHLTTGLDESDRAVFVQLQLGDFTRIGANPLSLLKRTISNYIQSDQLD